MADKETKSQAPASSDEDPARNPSILRQAAGTATKGEVFAKGQGLPGRYVVDYPATDDEPARTVTVDAGKPVPDDLPDKQRRSFEDAGYITTAGEDPKPVKSARGKARDSGKATPTGARVGKDQ